MASPQRKYQLTRVESGDYLFPSHDATALWRVNRYEEDGSLMFDDGRTVRGTFWRSARFNGSLDQADRLLKRDPEEFLSWEHWIEWDTLLKTRAEAISSALRSAVPSG